MRLHDLTESEQMRKYISITEGLDMSDGARMKRAQQMGFDTHNVMYHGTNADFSEFDKGSIGKNFTDSIDGGFFFTQKRRTALSFGGNVLSVFLKPIDVLVVKRPEIDARLEDPNYPTAEFYNPVDVYDRQNAELLQDAKRQGKHAIKIEGFKDDDFMVVFSPSQIRSIDAAFDPSQSESGNLMA